LGVLNSGALISVTRSGSGAITETDVHGMLARLLPRSFTEAIFAASPGAMAKMLATGLVQAYADHTGRVRHSLIGFPLRVSEKPPSLGSPGDLLLIDRSFYAVCDRVNEKNEVDFGFAISAPSRLVS